MPAAKITLIVAASVLGIFLLVAVIGSAVAPSDVAAVPSNDETPQETLPAAPDPEKVLLSAQADAASREASAPNDIVRRQGRAAWEREVCRAVSQPAFQGWTATVKRIDGDGSFDLALGGVDLAGSTVEGSPPYQALSWLSVGDEVRASGRSRPQTTAAW